MWNPGLFDHTRDDINNGMSVICSLFPYSPKYITQKYESRMLMSIFVFPFIACSFMYLFGVYGPTVFYWSAITTDQANEALLYPLNIVLQILIFIVLLSCYVLMIFSQLGKQWQSLLRDWFLGWIEKLIWCIKAGSLRNHCLMYGKHHKHIKALILTHLILMPVPLITFILTIWRVSGDFVITMSIITNVSMFLLCVSNTVIFSWRDNEVKSAMRQLFCMCLPNETHERLDN